MKVWTPESVWEVFANNKDQMCKGLVLIYRRQTADEREDKVTRNKNGVGFNAFDAEILSSFAEQYLRRGFLSDKQLAILEKKLHRYRKQLADIANEQEAKREARKEQVAV